MDLLAGYSDENSKYSPQTNSSKKSATTTERSLEDEWASFEKLIDGEEMAAGGQQTRTDDKSKRKFSEATSAETYSFEVQSGSSSNSSSRSNTPEKEKSEVIVLEEQKKSSSKEKNNASSLPSQYRPRKDSGKGSSTSRSRSKSPSSRKSKDKKSRSRERKSKKEKRHRSSSRSRKRSSSRHRSTKSRRSRSRKRSHSRSRRSSRDRKSSRDRHRHRSKGRDHKKRHSSRSPKRRHSRSPKRRHSRSPRRRHSRSPKRRHSRSPRRRHSRSPRRRRSRSYSPRRRHSRSYSRSRSPSPRYKSVPTSSYQNKINGTLAKKPLSFREKMRQDLLKAGKLLDSENDASGGAGCSSMLSGGENVTPQIALLHTMAAMHQKAQEITGVAVPKYYNPAAVNPLKYAEQFQKRKLLWSKNKVKNEEKTTPDQWQSTAFKADSDGKMATKFRKLMGMKEDAPITDEALTEEQRAKREEIFARLDQDYEFARMSTHTHRGVGLGFASQGMAMPQFPQP